MSEIKMKQSVYLGATRNASKCAESFKGYAASIDKAGDVIVSPLQEGSSRVNYGDIRTAVLKKR